MEKFVIVFLSFVMAGLFYFSAQAIAADKPERWVVYYGEALPSERFLPYDLIVFDSQKSPALRPLMNRGKTILGYLSVAEAEKYRYDFSRIEKMGALLGENPDWPGHYIIDIRNREWIKYLIEVKIPEILHKNFDGLMLDTLDSALYLWEKDKVKYAGMDRAAINLIRTIRKHYPYVKIMVNRGFQVLPEIAPYVDMVLAESIMVNFKTDSKEPAYFDEKITQYYMDIISKAQARNSAVKVYSLDYWPPSEGGEVKKIYQAQRARGYIPYVTTIDLMAEHGEPK